MQRSKICPLIISSTLHSLLHYVYYSYLSCVAGHVYIKKPQRYVGVQIFAHIQGIYTPPTEQSDWSECYSHGFIHV